MENYVGKRLDGRYEIRDIIGVGGMAVVYKAYDNIDERIVAVKILKDEFLANDEFRRRFKNESKAIAVLSHPNIVKVYDVSLGDKLQYIVMEYVEGITLKEYIEQQHIIPWKEAIHFATQILRALQHAHDKGIVHRDIKPQNIMLLENGTIKVTDFGIARFSRGETRTMTEAAIGSVHYISPEQARGEATDDKADIYSVGVVLYEMITGRLPFESDSAVSVALMQVQDEPEAPRKINASIPIGLEQITMHAMEKDTWNRYQSAAEMLLDLDELKRNPSIKFDYCHYVDPNPTTYVETPVQATPDYAHVASSKPVEQQAKDRAAEEAEEKKKKILKISGAAVAVVAIVLIVLWQFTDVFSGNKVTVPNFIGLNYAEEVVDNPKYKDFKFVVSYVTSTNAEEGTISKQTPESGEKVKSGTSIKLEVVSNGDMAVIPDIKGLSLAEARDALEKAGIKNVKVQEEENHRYKVGTVFDCSPSEGEKIDVNEPVVLYVSASNEVKVPKFIGIDYYGKRDKIDGMIKEANLKLGNVEEKDSSESKGTILSQSIQSGSMVNPGTTIDLIISSGKNAPTEVNVSVQLPVFGKDGSNENGTYRLYVNNTMVKEASVLCDGSVYTQTINASGTDTKVVVTINDQTLYEATVDCTKTPVKPRKERHYEVSSGKDESSSGLFGMIRPKGIGDILGR